MKVLTVSPTNKCALQCDHCGPVSGPNANGFMKVSTIKKIINDFHDQGFRSVNFSGGEPTLLGRKLNDLVEYAFAKGMKTRVTTGGYWGKKPYYCEKRVEGLAKAGLNELVLSVSDAHLKFVTLSHVLNIARSARNCNVPLIINLGIYKDSETTVKHLIQYFQSNNEPVPYIRESKIIPFGRAKSNYKDAKQLLTSVSALNVPCPSILRNVQVTSNGTVTACNSIFSTWTKSLWSGNIYKSTPEQIMSNMQNNPLFIWIHTFGPVALKNLVESNSDLRFKGNYTNICHLCGDILHNKKALEILKKEELIEISQ